MTGDNSLGVAPDVKRKEVDPFQSYCCHGSGETMPHVDVSDAMEDCRSRYSPTCSFNPRPFPPPSLVGVPTEYIIDQLHLLAPHYWDKPETADCTIGGPPPTLCLIDPTKELFVLQLFLFLMVEGDRSILYYQRVFPRRHIPPSPLCTILLVWVEELPNQH